MTTHKGSTMDKNHEAQDDMAEFAAATDPNREPWHHPHFRVSEGGYRIDTHRPMPAAWPQAAEAATEVGQEEDDTPHVSGAFKWPVLIVLGICLVSLCWNVAGVLL